MRPEEIATQCREMEIVSLPDVLRYLSASVIEAQLVNGMRVLDSSDVKQWLRELAAEFEDFA